jgi:arylsulfatase A-like enzyme
VPDLIEWPARVKHPVRTDFVSVRQDMYPTILDIAGVQMPNQPVVDGIRLLPLLDGKIQRRPKPIGFVDVWVRGEGGGGGEVLSRNPIEWIDGNYRMVMPPPGEGEPKLFDIYADPADKNDLAAKNPEIITRMRKDIEAWRVSVRNVFSRQGLYEVDNRQNKRNPS